MQKRLCHAKKVSLNTERVKVYLVIPRHLPSFSALGLRFAKWSVYNWKTSANTGKCPVYLKRSSSFTECNLMYYRNVRGKGKHVQLRRKLANCEMFKLRYLKTSSRIWLSTVGSIVMSKEKWKNHGIYWGGKLDNWKLQYRGFVKMKLIRRSIFTGVMTQPNQIIHGWPNCSFSQIFWPVTGKTTFDRLIIC